MRLDHVAIACRDVERMRAWYEEALSFTAAARKPPPRPGAQAAYLIRPPDGGATLELMADDGGASAPRAAFTRGLSHVAIQVADFDACEARLTALGVRWLGDRAEALGGGILRSFLDPEENMLQIVQR
jgi:catechol 2,3-dioxygenase-like lactoylglutathione lyase family enzyme